MACATLLASSRLLFVYGSLKRGQANHAELGGATFVSDARTAPRFALRLIAGYPALVPGARAIRGELHRIPHGELSDLDEFEGDAYVRATVELDSGAEVIAYLSRTPDAGVAYPADEWPSAEVG